jgi:hypothetical protein
MDSENLQNHHLAQIASSAQHLLVNLGFNNVFAANSFGAVGLHDGLTEVGRVQGFFFSHADVGGFVLSGFQLANYPIGRQCPILFLP